MKYIKPVDTNKIMEGKTFMEQDFIYIFTGYFNV